MLNAQIKKGTASRIELTGNIREIVSDLATMINAIYFQVKSYDPNTAECFRYVLTRTVADKNSPLFRNALEGTTGIMVKKEENGHETN